MKIGLLGRVTALAVSSLIALAGVELGVRLMVPEGLRSNFVTPDPVLHHRYVAGARARYRQTEFDTGYAINSLALREREITAAKPAFVRRVLVLGDSFTEGIGVEVADAYPARLQGMLDRDGFAGRWQVINAGLGSYSPLLEYVFLKREGLRLDPDLVILSFDLSDIYDDIQYTALARFDASGHPVAVGPDPEPPSGSFWEAPGRSIKTSLKRHLRTYNFLRYQAAPFLDGVRLTPTLNGDIRNDKYAMLRASYVPRDDRDFALSYRYLLLIRDALRARGVDFLLVLYPYGLQISPKEWDQGRLVWGFEPGVVYSTRPQEIVAEFARKNEIEVLDLCERFRESSLARHPLYFAYDGHWRPAGHEVMAEALYERLSSYVKEHDSPISTRAAPGAPEIATP